MLKPAVLNGAEKLRLEQEVSEARAVDPHVTPVDTHRETPIGQIRLHNHEI